MTKGQVRQIRKNAQRIKRELDYHAGSESEYDKVAYFNHDVRRRDYFVVHRGDYETAMNGVRA